MLGRIFQTLQYRLDKEDREWRSENRILRENSPGRFVSLLLSISESSITFAGVLSVVAITVTMLTWLLPEKYWVLFSVKILEIEDRSAYFAALWSVQAAVVALVYPIVIGFVALLITQSNNKAALHIYLYHTAAQLAGVSAMGLVAIMGFQYLVMPYVSIDAVALWTLIDGIWFIANAGLTTFFLYRTFQFIRPRPRFDIIQKYGIAVAWPREVRFHLARSLFRTACEDGSLEGPSYANVKRGEPCVLLGVPEVDIGRRVVLKKQRRVRELRDIRFLLLNKVVRRWLRRERAAVQHEGATARKDIVIGFPVLPFNRYGGDVQLCRIAGVSALSRFEQRLVSLSFAFGSPNRRLGELTTRDILADLEADVIGALRSSEPENFKHRARIWAGTLKLLLAASETKDKLGAPINLAALPDTNNPFFRPMYEQWTRPLLDLFDAASEKLKNHEDYLSTLAYVSVGLFSTVRPRGDDTTLRHFIELTYYLFLRINRWWTQTIEQQGVVIHGPCSPAKLKPPSAASHDRVLRSFVGAWESLKSERIPGSPRKGSEWRDVQRSAVCFEAHLVCTLKMLMDCVVRGDQNGAEWMADVIIKWYPQFIFALDEVDFRFLPGAELLTLDLIERDWSAVEHHIRFEGAILRNKNPMSVMLSACLRNLWVDVCSVALYVLAIWGKQCDCDTSLAGSIYRAILNGQSLRQGGVLRGRTAMYESADGLVRAATRQSLGDRTSTASFRSRIDGYVEQVIQLTQVEMVSGRVYSGFGSNGFDSVTDGLLFSLLILAARTSRRPEDRIGEILPSLSGEQMLTIQSMINGWQERLNAAGFEDWKKAFDCYFAQESGASEFEAALDQLKSYVSDLSGLVENTLQQAIGVAEPSHERLAEIARSASRTGFSKLTGAFPLGLFEQVESVNTEFDEYSLTFKQYQKGQLTAERYSHVVANEDEWFDETLKLHLGGMVMWRVLQGQSVREVSADSAESYWEEIKSFLAAYRDLRPILLLENPAIPEWVWDWAHPPYNAPSTALPGDLVVTRDRDFSGNDYLCSFNDTPVFRAPIESGASVLITRASLKSVQFTEGEHSLVKAEVRDIEGKRDLVDLVLKWRMKVTVDRGPAVRLVYTQQERSNPAPN